MNIEDFIEYVHANPERVLGIPGTAFHLNGKGTKCPICNSGTNGHRNTGPTSLDGIHFRCWAGCYESADVIDIIGIEYGLNDFMDKIDKTAEIYGIDIEKDAVKRNQKGPKKERIEKQAAAEPEEPEPDYTEFFEEAAANIEKTDYHRGLPLDILKQYNIGYIENWKSPTAIKNGYSPAASPRLIIPTSAHSYTARATNDNAADRYKKEGHTHIFNLQALYKTSSKYVILVEGEINALSILAAGGNALALGSVALVNKFLEKLQELKQQNIKPNKLIIALDNDKAGKQGTETLIQGLEKLNFKLNKDFFTLNIYGAYNDANEAYNGDIKQFTANVSYAMNIEAEAYKAKCSDTEYISNFIEDIRSYSGQEFYPTGFKNLDKQLDGGLHTGLYAIGAVSSLGKTTLCLQIADNIAASKKDVMFFTLEMAKKEIMAKRVSRLTYTLAQNDKGGSTGAKTTIDIMASSKYKDYTKAELKLIDAAQEEYKKHGAANMYTIEGSIKEEKGQPRRTGVKEIRAAVEEHIEKTGNKPVVFIDYLQMLGPEDIRATDKQNTDAAILRLKQLSRDFNIPVVVISSFNRDSYTEPVSLKSWKESGGIEYSSDVLIGLQYEGIEYKQGEKGEKDAARQARIRELTNEEEENGRKGKMQHLQWKVVKNRNGTKGSGSIGFYPIFNYFTEPEEDATDWKNITETEDLEEMPF